MRSAFFAMLAGLLIGAQAADTVSTKAVKEAAAEQDLKAAIHGLKSTLHDFGKVNKTLNKTDGLAKDKELWKGFVHELTDKVGKDKPVEVSFEKPDAADKPGSLKEDVLDIIEKKLNETKTDLAGFKKDLEGPIVVNVTTVDLHGVKKAVWSELKNATSKPGKDVIDMIVAAKDELKAEKAAGKKGEVAADARLEAAKDALKARLVGKAANLTKHA